MVTGDGDGLSIGGNHTIHMLRRNLDLNVMLFNNRIYGLTKGQYSPTSEVGKVTKSTPMGSFDIFFNPLSLALGWICVNGLIDKETKHLQTLLKDSYEHIGHLIILEIHRIAIYLMIDAFSPLTDRETS